VFFNLFWNFFLKQKSQIQDFPEKEKQL
jgi:hypothetical protein